jgi:hypothetical protein
MPIDASPADEAFGDAVATAQTWRRAASMIGTDGAFSRLISIRLLLFRQNT